ncbi:MAG TPA: hypothetical protein VHC73_00415 [Vitreimonas sp.]|jgi:hypothetical protein|nr:hypothetical protein [Vitreimonas sp.]
MRYPVILIGAGLVCLIAGESFGMWMAQNPQNFLYAPAHAHLNLAGWVTLSLYGLIHRAYPALAESKLATAQASLAILGGVLVGPGIVVAINSGEQNPSLAIAASVCIMLGTLLFGIMFVGKAVMAKTT